MFMEPELITPVICLPFSAGTEGSLGYGMSFETLLGKAIAMFLLFIYYYGLQEPWGAQQRHTCTLLCRYYAVSSCVISLFINDLLKEINPKQMQIWIGNRRGRLLRESLNGVGGVVKILASFWRHFLSKSQLRMNSGSTQDQLKVRFRPKKRT